LLLLTRLLLDLLRYDAVSYAQNAMSRYDGYLKINTPNIDRLAESGVRFETAYW